MAVIEAIETLYLEADASTVSFSSIAGYQHLELHFSVATDDGYDWDQVTLRFNDDSGTNYTYRTMYTYSSTDTAFGSGGAEARTLWNTSNYRPNSVGPTGQGGGVITILDYLNANKNTSICGVGGLNNAVGLNRGMQGMCTAVWDDTSAVTKITLIPQYGDWIRSSSFTLYGIKSS